MKKRSFFPVILFVLVFVVAIVARWQHINAPITEWFSWRQSDTAAVGKLYAKDGIDLLRPRYYDISRIQSGIDNPQGLRMVEFPLYNASFGWLYKTFPQVSIEMWARMVTALLSLGALTALYIMLRDEIGEAAAFFGGLFFALCPYIVFYSRSILPDMPATSIAVISGLMAHYYVRTKRWYFLVGACVLFAVALLIKPTVIFYALLLMYFIMKGTASKRMAGLLIIVVLGLAAIPVYWWRQYILQFPEGIPASDWLLTSVNTSTGLHSVFMRPAFFRWILFERINNLILGGYLTFFAILGLFFSNKKSYVHWVFAAVAASYLLTFQGGNVQHDYYQIIITPALAVLIGAGVHHLLTQKGFGFRAVRYLCIVVLFVLGIAFSYYQVNPYYNQNSDLLLIADVMRSITKSSDRIVVDAQGDSTVLYIAERFGYPAIYNELEQIRAEGKAEYFVTTNSDYKQKLDGVYPLVFENDKVLIFSL